MNLSVTAFEYLNNFITEDSCCQESPVMLFYGNNTFKRHAVYGNLNCDLALAYSLDDAALADDSDLLV